MQVAVTIPVPGTLTPSAWVPSSLVTVTSVGLSSTATSTDTVQLCGSNDNTVLVDSTHGLGGYFGGQTLQNMGPQSARLGAFLYFAVIRTGGSTGGLTFVVIGDDGAGGGGGGGTVNQGNPNAGGVLSWPVVDANLSLVESRTLTGTGAAVQASALTGTGYLTVFNLDATQAINISTSNAVGTSNAAIAPGTGRTVRYTDLTTIWLLIPNGVKVTEIVER